MKSQFVTLAIVLAGLPALAWGQAPCGCSPRSGSVMRPAAYETWSDYHPASYHGGYEGGGCGGCSSCCTPCCRPLLCIIPNTIRKIGRTLDCLLPCGPRSGHGCGITCIGAGSGCASCSGGCPSCSSPAMHGDPFQDDEPMLPMAPKPAPEHTRRQPTTMRAPREYAAAPSAGKKMASPRPSTRSVLTRAPQPAEEVVSRANHTDTAAKKSVSVVKRTSATAPLSTSTTQSARRSSAIPNNPLR